MTSLLVSFWTVIIFSSIAWYAALLFYVGYRGGHEILRMAQDLRSRHDAENHAPEEA